MAPRQIFASIGMLLSLCAGGMFLAGSGNDALWVLGISAVNLGILKYIWKRN